jgi:excisionase family DNA binding protein
MQSPERIDQQEALCVNVATAAKWLGIDRNTAYQMVRSGQLKAIRCGLRRLKIPIAALRRLLEDTGQDDLHGSQIPHSTTQIIK